MGLSLLWSVDPGRTFFLLREDMAPVLGLMIVFGILPLEESMKWFIRGMKVMVVITALVLLFEPETRLWIRDGLESEAWRGWFLSKNEMGRSMLLAFMAMLYLDKTRVSRWVFMALAVVLLLGSSSATALAGAMFAVGIWVWGLQFRRTRRQWSGMFIFTSVVLGIFVLLAAFLSAAFLVELLGRDLSFSGRTDVWVPSLDYVQDRPILGYGYRALFGSPTEETLVLWRELGFTASHSHNGPLEIALGMGLIGLGMFFLVYLSTFTAALRYLKEFDVAVFSFCFMLVMLPVAVVEPVFQGDWFAMLVVCRMMLLRVRVETRGTHVPG
jgi:O-antigen ligase